MPTDVAVGSVLTIGAVIAYLRHEGKAHQLKAQQMVADVDRQRQIGQMRESQRRGQLLQRERDMTNARMHMALQQQGIYAYGDPTMAPYAVAAAAGSRRGG